MVRDEPVFRLKVRLNTKLPQNKHPASLKLQDKILNLGTKRSTSLQGKVPPVPTEYEVGWTHDLD